MSKQEQWFVWDNRGGIHVQTTHCQTVNFDLEKNRAAWEKMGAKITGSIESGRMTYKQGYVVVEFWREDKPNPTPYTIFDNPDPIEKADGDTRTYKPAS